jgi:hypothetical protein
MVSYQYLLHDLMRLIQVEVSVDLFIILPLPQIALFGGFLLFSLAGIHGVKGTGGKFV